MPAKIRVPPESVPCGSHVIFHPHAQPIIDQGASCPDASRTVGRPGLDSGGELAESRLVRCGGGFVPQPVFLELGVEKLAMDTEPAGGFGAVARGGA